METPTAAAPATGGADLETLARVVGRIRTNIEKVIEGKADVVSSTIVVLLAEGHLLIEDVPGVGKTMLSKALARSIDCSVRRIQFTPDLLPSDVTGVSIFNQNSREFEFRPGGVFANIVVGDEINRASPKTQSALLECMEERQVTVDNATYQLESPFMVIATQNPIEMEGTYALPEAQRDRFMARVSIGYPVEAAEIAMLDSHTRSNPLDDLEPVADAAEIRKLIGIVGQVYVSQAVQRYAVALTAATRRSDELSLGASPRATLHLVRAAKAMAAHAGTRLRAARRRARAGPAGARTPPAPQRRGVDERPLDLRDPRRRSWRACPYRPAPSRGGAGMREALSGLTVRGRAFVAAGVTAIVCAIVLGQTSLSRVGVLVLALPLVSAFFSAAAATGSRWCAPSTRSSSRPGSRPRSACRWPTRAERPAACSCWRTTSPTCSAPGRGSCSRASATAGAAT